MAFAYTNYYCLLTSILHTHSKVEENTLVYPGQAPADEELLAQMSYAVNMVQGNSSYSFLSDAGPSSTDACSSPDSFKVAIVDSGLNTNHPDAPCHGNFIDEGVDGTTNCIGALFLKNVDMEAGLHTWYESGYDHGTHVTGTIGAVARPFSMNPDSSGSGICFLFARIFNDQGQSVPLMKIFKAAEWAMNNGAKVINMSVSSSHFSSIGQDYFDRIHDAGVIAVASSGNTYAGGYQYPAAFERVMAVGAVDQDGVNRLASSTYNDKVDIAGPGKSIYSMSLNNDYSYKSGTSMAAAHVTGAIAKSWSVCRECSADTVQGCILGTAKELGGAPRTNEFGEGLLQTYDAYLCLVDDGCCPFNANSDDPADPEDSGPGGSWGDPHFKTWHGEVYDFHGECDLVLAKSEKLGFEAHVRTKIRRDWSFVSGVAVKIGEDILEVGGNHKYYVNGVQGAELPASLSGFPVSTRIYDFDPEKAFDKFSIDLGEIGEVIIKVFGEFLAISISLGANTDLWEGAVGLMGEFESGKLLGRDGKSIFKDTNLFGLEWQVNDDQVPLFQEAEGPQFPAMCNLPRNKLPPLTMEQRRRLSGEEGVSYAEAVKVCQSVPLATREACISDATITGNMLMAVMGLDFD